ncbi:MAG TPA: tetratricopeptide repeat protein, partial [Acidobacteriota bacterium]|nr:tetratricopeptide repeat protein [Acidobacteriota bacterium]
MKPQFLAAFAVVLIVLSFSFWKSRADIVPTKPEDLQAQIEAALYTRAEFFGSQALVPIPTAEARTRMEALHAQYPQASLIARHLSQLDEKLGNPDLAEKEIEHYAELEHQSVESLELVAAFQNRQARFDHEAKTLERLLNLVPKTQKVSMLQRLMAHARKHNLTAYLGPQYYQNVLEQDPSVVSVIIELIDWLAGEKNYPEALKLVRQYKPHFPQNTSYFVVTEANLLANLGREKEAESVFSTALDAQWSEALAQSFDTFLDEHDRYRAFYFEVKEQFLQHPESFSLLVKRLHYLERHYTGGSVKNDILRHEKARAERNQPLTPDELLIISHYLIEENQPDEAARYLYTVCLQTQVKPGDPIRAKVLYQLFEILMDAQNEQLSLTNNDLQFYQDIATADSHPGLFGAVLSLIFSDSDVGDKFEEKQTNATRFFNKAAAFRIFSAYKQENPTSPELAQMYLDIVRLYAATQELQIADATLVEFEQRHQNASQFPEVALKLADAYLARDNRREEQAVLQRVLDYFGKNRKPGDQLLPVSPQIGVSTELTGPPPFQTQTQPQSPSGINIPNTKDSSTTENWSYSYSSFNNHLGLSAAVQPQTITYAIVLDRLVSSLFVQERRQDILSLYASELKKYPDEQGLYEQWLQWLDQTNLAEEQLRVYREAITHFPTTLWHHRLARWLIRTKRDRELETFSRQLISTVNDAETEAYLSNFIASRLNSSTEFDRNLCLGLYQMAHKRFPHNLMFVNGLLRYYEQRKEWTEWRKLMAEYVFVSPGIRQEFLSHLASRKELRSSVEQARKKCATTTKNPLELLPYKLFQADAAIRLSDFEGAVETYRELIRLYPNNAEFTLRLVALNRSFGQKDRTALTEAATIQHAYTEANPAISGLRTTSGELYAELGDYGQAKAEWEKLLDLGRGEPEIYLDTATLYWDYFQYDDALHTIWRLREQLHNDSLYAYQAGAIHEAKHERPQALAEYVKALNQETTDYADRRKTRARLHVLYDRQDVPQALEQALAESYRTQPQPEWLVLGYAEFLKEVGQEAQAVNHLKTEVTQSRSQEFLTRARSFFRNSSHLDGEATTLHQLIASAKSHRFAISFHLQLAELYKNHRDLPAADRVLRQLRQRYPLNYGVLTETADIYWRMGQSNQALEILKQGRQRSIGRFAYRFARKLAARYLDLNQFPQAEQILRQLHQENPLDSGVFQELARMYVKTSQPAALGEVFQQSLSAIQKQDIEIQEIRYQVADVREKMITAFTQLKDYDAAIDQHIEIINREPDDEDRLNVALSYAKRYGGSERLLAYYQQTAKQAYKNYRWYLVLARIYEAKNDWPKAIENYRTAIGNQPEKVDLYAAIAEAHLKLNQLNEAIKALRKAAELTNDDPVYLKKLINVLEQAGYHKEAAVVRQKLPEPPPPKQQTLSQQLAEAEQLRTTDRAKAIELYRKVFETYATNPYKNEINIGDLTSYVQTLHSEEPLDKIAGRLWDLRQKLITERESPTSLQAGTAQERIKFLNYGLVEALAAETADRATGDELAVISQDLRQRIELAVSQPDQFETLSLLRNFSAKAGFTHLEEEILKAQLKTSTHVNDFHRQQVFELVEFYRTHGDFQQALVTLVAEYELDPDKPSVEYLEAIADESHRLNNPEKELWALRTYYQRYTGELWKQPAPTVERYFELLFDLGDSGKAELRACAEKPSPFQLQLINFLIRKQMTDLAYLAIHNAPLSPAWKSARTAQTGLVLHELTPPIDEAFHNALQLTTIGELVKQRPDTTSQLVGDDWAMLAQNYGQWLFQKQISPEKQITSPIPPAGWLQAGIENRPEDAAEQVRLGRWFLAHHDAQSALTHLTLALENTADPVAVKLDLGQALWQLGETANAKAQWEQVIASNFNLESSERYVRILTEHGLSEQGRARLFPILVKELKRIEKENDEGYESDPNRQFEPLKSLLHTLSASFHPELKDDTPLSPAVAQAQAAYFNQLCLELPKNSWLAETVIGDSLVSETEHARFYQILIDQSSRLDRYSYDYQFTDQLKTTFNPVRAEEILDHKNDYRVEEPQSDRLKWQQMLLEYQLSQQQTAAALNTVETIENELKTGYPRPEWLRLTRFRLEAQTRTTTLFEELTHFCGIETYPETLTVQGPSLRRVNDVVALLQRENRTDLAQNLLQAAYERMLALEQLEPSAFIGLARLAFERNDAHTGLQFLNFLTSLDEDETRETTQAAVARLPFLANRVITDPVVEKPDPVLSVSRGEALSLGAELAAEFGQIELAIQYRQRVRTIHPENEINRLELARLLALANHTSEAIAELAAVMGDRSVLRKTRWLAVWLAPELIGTNTARWTTLEQMVQTKGDTEMLTAIQAKKLASINQPSEALQRLNQHQAVLANPYGWFFRALLEKATHQPGQAIADFSRAQTNTPHFSMSESFGLTEADPQIQQIGLYLDGNQPRAAFSIADKLTSPEVRGQGSGVGGQGSGIKILEDFLEPGARSQGQTLQTLTQNRQRQIQLEILERLSLVAEQINALDIALKYENQRLALLADAAQQLTSEARIEKLSALLAAQPAPPAPA